MDVTIQLALRRFPSAVARQIKQAAAERDMTLTEFMVMAASRVLSDSPASSPAAGLDQDLAWYEHEHATLGERFPTGTYLAIVDQHVIDNDTDPAALAERVRERFSRRSIFMPRIDQRFSKMHLRSPRRLS